jgi:Family of unknown function (DUF6011)
MTFLDDMTALQPPLRECMLQCGNPATTASGYCADCAGMLAQHQADHERREQRKKAKAEREAHLAELARQGCGCSSEAECRLNSTDWHAIPKSKQRKLYAETRAGCMKVQRWNAEYRQRQEERDQQERDQQERERQEERDQQERERHEQRRREILDFKNRLRQLGRLEPVPLLVYLRDVVLRNRHDRCPKWLFCLAPDLVLQLQPRPGERRDDWCLFLGTAIQGNQIRKDHFASRKARHAAGLEALEFGILPSARDTVDPTPGQWLVRVTAGDRDSAPALLARLIEGVRQLELLDRNKMFSPACLNCGRALTDPASQARWIGPECAGTTSLDARVFATPEAA